MATTTPRPPRPTAPVPSGSTRRGFLAAAGAVGAGGLLGASSWKTVEAAPHAASAPAVGRRPGNPNGRLLLVFLRGAADHLSITVPTDEPDYGRLRPGIAIDARDTLELDGRFGFHPAMPRLHERFRAGQLAPIVAIGNPAGDRSHFVSQDLYERGSAGGSADGTSAGNGTGWLARHLGATATDGDTPLRAITVGSNVDTSLLGFGAVGIRSIGSFGIGSAGGTSDELAEVLRLAHGSSGPLGRAAAQAIDAAAVVGGLPASEQRDPVLAAFDDIATLLDADLGTDVITANIDRWDTHTRMGDADGGDMADLLTELDTAVGGLADALDDRGVDDVTTLVVTEFGRRVAENGSGGCDHGWGSVALAMGPSVRGGTVHGEWLGLDDDVLGEHRGDVPATTDFRDLLADAVCGVLDGDAAVTFPGHEHRPTGVFAT